MHYSFSYFLRSFLPSAKNLEFSVEAETSKRELDVSAHSFICCEITDVHERRTIIKYSTTPPYNTPWNSNHAQFYKFTY